MWPYVLTQWPRCSGLDISSCLRRSNRSSNAVQPGVPQNPITLLHHGGIGNRRKVKNRHISLLLSLIPLYYRLYYTSILCKVSFFVLFGPKQAPSDNISYGQYRSRSFPCKEERLHTMDELKGFIADTAWFLSSGEIHPSLLSLLSLYR